MKLTVKLAGLFAVVAFALTAVTPASAQTVEELQALISQLQAQISALGSTTVTAVPSFTYTRDLTLGATGSDVIALQSFLEAKGMLTIPAGVSKGYFGALTASALAKYQASVGIAPAVGYFGPVTRAKVNVDSANGTTTTPGTPATPGNDLSGGEASLESFDLSSGDDSEVSEGDSAAVAEIEFDVEDGDIMIDRIDLALVAASSTQEETDPWDAFDSISLTVDGEEIASMDLDDEDEYLDEDDGTIRLSGIDFKVEEGETVTIVVEVTAASSVDGVDTEASWTLSVDGTEGIRATDAEGIQQYTGSDSDSVTFDIEEEGADEELTVRSSSSDIEATSLKVEDDEKSDTHAIFVFDIEAEEADVELDSVEVVIDTASEATASVVSDYILEIDGEEFDDWSYVTGAAASTTRTISFDIDGDFTIDADSEVEVVLMAEFNAANGTNYDSGDTIEASIISGAVSGEGADDLTSTGAASGEEHVLLTSGLTVEEPTVDSDSEDGVGTFSFEIDLTAFEEDVTIATSSAAIADNLGFDWSVVGGTATSTITVQSDADIVGVNYVIDEGSTETFTITITVDPVAAGSFYVVLDDVTYTSNSVTTTHEFQPQSAYDTSAVSVSAN